MERLDRSSAGAGFSTGELSALSPEKDVRLSQVFLALSMIGLGLLGLIHGDFALVWQRMPVEHLPGRTLLAYATALVELVCGVGLLAQRTTKLSSTVLLAFMLLWVVLLQLPPVIAAPQMEIAWLGLGETCVILAGAWVLFASHQHRAVRSLRYARLLFAVSLPMIGLSHFFYSEQTAAFVPAWLPYRLGWAYLTGAGSIVACLAVLLAVAPRLAATLEAAMLWVITLLVWLPAIVANPADRMPWTAFTISAAIACGAWVVADTYRHVGWLSTGSAARRLPGD